MKVYQYLIDGQAFSRTLSAESFDYYLGKIFTDSGDEQLFVSLDALEKHIEYLENIRSYKMVLVRDVYTKYAALISEGFGNQNTSDNDEVSFPEGKEIYRLHKFKERNRALIKLAKENYKKSNSAMNCQICNFSFFDTYGEIGDGFIEAHHIFPISELKAETPTRLDDLILVCSNCHRMLHRRRPWLTKDALSELLQNG